MTAQMQTRVSEANIAECCTMLAKLKTHLVWSIAGGVEGIESFTVHADDEDVECTKSIDVGVWLVNIMPAFVDGGRPMPKRSSASPMPPPPAPLAMLARVEQCTGDVSTARAAFQLGIGERGAANTAACVAATTTMNVSTGKPTTAV